MKALLLTICFIVPLPAHADFTDALRTYGTKNYEKARAEFLALAELGDARSQHNLAAMAFSGEAGPKDRGEALGWLIASQENGFVGHEKIIERLRSELNPVEIEKANAIVARYGWVALNATILPTGRAPGCSGGGSNAPRPLQAIVPTYPIDARRSEVEGFVLVEFTVGLDGLPRDAEILNATPEGAFESAVLDALFRSRFEPARRDNRPSEERRTFGYKFYLDEGETSPWNMPVLRKIKKASDIGVPAAQYIIALISVSDRQLGIKPEEIDRLMLESAQGGEKRAQYWLHRSIECESSIKSRFWLERAAAANHPAASMKLALKLLTESSDPDTHARAIKLLHTATTSKDSYVLSHVIAILAASAVPSTRDPALAIKLGKQLSGRPRSPDPQMEEVIAAAHAFNGDFPAAIKFQERALSKATELHWNTASIEERLSSYRASQPWFGDLFALPPSDSLPEIKITPVKRACSNEEDETKRGGLVKCPPLELKKGRQLE